ncbi:hypothetical protein AT251_15290 [Enterovibrio nigricans]|nr:4'-phosphopantetheinyl transferase superfamily protein [Enterovibrio nigricans]PKF49935.1 hypothetical protein AT251_15290 [Enterovibrio nigricans]
MFQEFNHVFSTQESQTGYLDRLSLASNSAGTCWLASCSFQLERYEPRLYAELDIKLNDDIRSSVPKRQAEFLAGRYLAKTLLQSASSFDGEIKVGLNRQPTWPNGWIGSISHTDDRALVLGHCGQKKFAGIDIENVIPFSTCKDIATSIHSNEELALFVEQGIAENIATTLIFSAKESLFKATYPYIGYYFGFESAKVITLDVSKGYLILSLDHGIAPKLKSRWFTRVIMSTIHIL